MAQPFLPEQLKGFPIYFVGIKGTGMAALAELFHRRGAEITGSDTTDHFYTDEILKDLGIPFFEGFDASHVKDAYKLVVYSSAYNPAAHPELLRARDLGLPILTYTEALGLLSSTVPSAGISGVHGKTTTTAMAGTLIKTLGLSGSVLAGSAVSNFGNRSTYSGGEDFFVAETCEYRRNFLSFHPRWLVITSVEEDHLDYFKDYADILAAFVEYGRRLAEGGTLVFCADDRGACEAAGKILSERPDLYGLPYGLTAEGPFRVSGVETVAGATRFRLDGFRTPFDVRIPGLHSVLNATAAVALVASIREELERNSGCYGISCAGCVERKLAAGLAEFLGSKRRSEILGEAAGVLFVDDYAHHPTAIKTTLKGFRDFYPGRRIVADFMSHTYSRTKALLQDFSASFGSADLVVLHKIYASAREANDGSVSGRDLYEAARKLYPQVEYFDEPEEALPFLKRELRGGDLFITLGAGDNWRLGKTLFEALKKEGPNS